MSSCLILPSNAALSEVGEGLDLDLDVDVDVELKIERGEGGGGVECAGAGAEFCVVNGEKAKDCGEMVLW